MCNNVELPIYMELWLRSFISVSDVIARRTNITSSMKLRSTKLSAVGLSSAAQYCRRCTVDGRNTNGMPCMILVSTVQYDETGGASMCVIFCGLRVSECRFIS